MFGWLKRNRDDPPQIGRATPIERSYNWKIEHSRLWNELVPQRGHASTLQGELIRIAGKLTDEAYRNGNENWDEEMAAMWRFVGQQIADPQTFTTDELKQIRDAIASIIRDCNSPDVSGDSSPYYLVSQRVVDWCMNHPDPLPLPASAEFGR